MNVSIVVRSADGALQCAHYQADFLEAPMRASQISRTSKGIVNVEALGRSWLAYDSGRLTRRHDTSIYMPSEEKDCIEEMLDTALTYDISNFPRRFPVKLSSLG